MNQIPDVQNQEAQLALLRARKQTMDEASQVIILQFVLTVVVPALAAVGGVIYPSIRPYTAALALGITLLDVTLLDRMQRRKIKLFAKIAEAFDEAVLQLPWNRLAAGKRAEHSDVAAAQVAWSRRKISDEKLIDWYPVLVGRAPLHLGRIICQRTKLDGELPRFAQGINKAFCAIARRHHLVPNYAFGSGRRLAAPRNAIGRVARLLWRRPTSALPDSRPAGLNCRSRGVRYLERLSPRPR